MKLTGKVRERREVRVVNRGDGQKEVGDQDSMPTQSWFTGERKRKDSTEEEEE